MTVAMREGGGHGRCRQCCSGGVVATARPSRWELPWVGGHPHCAGSFALVALRLCLLSSCLFLASWRESDAAFGLLAAHPGMGLFPTGTGRGGRVPPALRPTAPPLRSVHAPPVAAPMPSFCTRARPAACRIGSQGRSSARLTRVSFRCVPAAAGPCASRFPRVPRTAQCGAADAVTPRVCRARRQAKDKNSRETNPPQRPCLCGGVTRPRLCVALPHRDHAQARARVGHGDHSFRIGRSRRGGRAGRRGGGGAPPRRPRAAVPRLRDPRPHGRTAGGRAAAAKHARASRPGARPHTGAPALPCRACASARPPCAARTGNTPPHL